VAGGSRRRSDARVDRGATPSAVHTLAPSNRIPLQMDSIINPINCNLKELVILKGFQRYESGQFTEPQSNKKNAGRWQSLEEQSCQTSQSAPKKAKEALGKIAVDYEPISLLQSSQFGETYLIRIKSQQAQ